MNGSICKNLFSLPIDRNMKPYYEQIQVVAAIETVIVGHTSISVVLNPFIRLLLLSPLISIHFLGFISNCWLCRSILFTFQYMEFPFNWSLLDFCYRTLRRAVHSWEIMFFFSPGNSNHQSWELPRTAQDCHLIIIIYFLINHLQYYRACSTRNVELHEKKMKLKDKQNKGSNKHQCLFNFCLFI